MIAAALLSILAAGGDGLLELPDFLRQDSPAEKKTQEETPKLDEPHRWDRSMALDLYRLEAGARVNFLAFSPNYDIDPTIGGSLLVRAPMPALSPRADPQGEYFGLFAEVTVAGIDRDLDFPVEHTSGTATFVVVGLDYTFDAGERSILRGQAGVLYAEYGDVSLLHDGWGVELGGLAGFRISDRLWFTASPETYLGSSWSIVYVASFGLQYSF
jgi:predicted small lipoprotein YifL